jgi:hypothetical protein
MLKVKLYIKFNTVENHHSYSDFAQVHHQKML